MKRLEFDRLCTNTATRRPPKNAADAVQVLAQIAREKLRLSQERKTWEKRVGKIDARLREIAGLELRLFPLALSEAPSHGQEARPMTRVFSPAPPAKQGETRLTEVTVTY